MLAAACGGKVSGSGTDGSSSSSGGASGSSGGVANSCLVTGGTSQACVTCVESVCTSELGAFETGCSGLLACECPGGVFSANAAETEACTSTAEAPECTSTLPALASCEAQYCEGPCRTTNDSSGGLPPASCALDATIACTGSAMGYSCAIGDDPGGAGAGLSCSTAVLVDEDSKADFCCFSGGAWDAATCDPDDEGTSTSTCPDPDTYGYQCMNGFDPNTLDSRLNCSASTPDPDGVHDDFCCTYE